MGATLRRRRIEIVRKPQNPEAAVGFLASDQLPMQSQGIGIANLCDKITSKTLGRFGKQCAFPQTPL